MARAMRHLTRCATTAIAARKAQGTVSANVVEPLFRQVHRSDIWRCAMKRLVKRIALAVLVALATLTTVEAVAARTLHQETPQVHDDSDTLYSRMVAPGGSG